jgi:hypothetical protein
MFLISILLGVTLGFLFRGNLRDFTHIKLNRLYIIFIGFGIELVVKVLMKYGLLKIGVYTCISDVIMYILLVVFVYFNRKNLFIVIMGIGSILNAIVIFSNGGVMPVSQSAMDSIARGITPANYGLYASINDTANFWFLSDIFYFKFTGPFIYSIGDIISVAGMIMLIVAGMRGKYNKYVIANPRGRSSRKSRRERKGRMSRGNSFSNKEAIGYNR